MIGEINIRPGPEGRDRPFEVAVLPSVVGVEESDELRARGKAGEAAVPGRRGAGIGLFYQTDAGGIPRVQAHSTRTAQKRASHRRSR